MDILQNSEKFIKRYLKNKISLDRGTVVKILIAGVASLSLGGCGGGGGGGGSSEKPTISQVENINLEKNNESHLVQGKNAIISGKITGTAGTENLVGITVKNSNIENRAQINLSGDGAVGIGGTIEKNKGTYGILNTGKINLEGKNSIGMAGINGMIVVNNGEIIGKGKGEEGVSKGSIGILVDGGSKGINNKNITIDGTYGIGMKGSNGSIVENNGNIDLSSKLVEGKYTLEQGMVVVEKSEGINNGLITGKGKIIGIYAEKSIGKNEENIELESFKEDGTVVTDEGDGYYAYLQDNMSKIVGMEGRGIGSQVINNNNIKLNGKGTGILVSQGGKGINNGNILGISKEVKGYGYSKGSVDGKLDWLYKEIGKTYGEIFGLVGENGEVENSSKGNISIAGKGTGIKVDNKGTGINDGNISMEAKVEIWSDTGIIGEPDPTTGEFKFWSTVTGMEGDNNSKIINNGSINIFNEGIGMMVYNDSNGINNGMIVIKNDRLATDDYNTANNVIAGMDIGNSNGINNGTIILDGVSIMGDFDGVNIENGNFVNDFNGKIEVNSHDDPSSGIYSIKGEVTNNGSIKVNSDMASVWGIYSENGKVVNNGSIIVSGKYHAAGIYSLNSEVINNGIINVDGNGAYGIVVSNGGTAINEKDGVINVSSTAAGGIYAGVSSTAINKGTINISEGNAGGVEVGLVGEGTLDNQGQINIAGDLLIDNKNGLGKYVIGTSLAGDYGKISGKNISLDGEVLVKADIVKDGFKNEYILENVVDGENINLGEEFKLISSSLLYTAEESKDIWGNLDGKLVRNDKTISDFAEEGLKSSGEIFGKYQEEEAFKKLSEDGKEVIQAINTESVSEINRSLKSLTPGIYGNLGRQLLETGEMFKEQDLLTIESLNNYKYNFTLLGKYDDIDGKNNIEGYKSKVSGFVGAMALSKDLYGTIGYGHNSIDYKNNGNGKIESIHMGLNKFMSLDDIEIKFGLTGEYNFHKNTREITLVNRNADSKFNSYGIRLAGELGKKYGRSFYVKPYGGMDLGYMKYEGFTESGAGALNAKFDSEGYSSISPRAGIVLGKDFTRVKLYGKVNYSYELGNMDKKQEYIYEGFEGTGKLSENSLESGNISLEAGTEFNYKNLVLIGSLGKNYGKRDNIFGKVSIGYRF